MWGRRLGTRSLWRFLVFTVLELLCISSILNAAPPGRHPQGGLPHQNEHLSESKSESKGSEPRGSEEDDYSQSPFTEYGEFNQAEDEEDDTRFFQFGRFFGVSLGSGFQMVDGNRGALWQGGFPVVALKLHYWFDFNLALDLGFTTAAHYYDDTSALALGHVIANLFKAGVNVKYYLPTKNLAAPISFANPYILLGAGLFAKTENSLTNNVTSTDNSLGVVGGGGLEFAIQHRKIYFALEYNINIVTFQDTYTTRYQPALSSLTGNFHTITGNILFTW